MVSLAGCAGRPFSAHRRVKACAVAVEFAHDALARGRTQKVFIAVGFGLALHTRGLGTTDGSLATEGFALAACFAASTRVIRPADRSFGRAFADVFVRGRTCPRRYVAELAIETIFVDLAALGCGVWHGATKNRGQ